MHLKVFKAVKSFKDQGFYCCIALQFCNAVKTEKKKKTFIQAYKSIENKIAQAWFP